jgi:hypothetical protein
MRHIGSKSNRFRKINCNTCESGQAMMFLLLALGLVLLGAAAFSVDMGNFWFHRQSAQNAADAACVAGAMDMLVDATNGAASQGGFTPSTSNTYDCSTNSTISPCQYAALNNYSGATTGSVVISFPSAVTGVPSSMIPPAANCSNPPCTGSANFMRVDVVDNVQTYFSGLLSGRRTQPIRAYSVCGTVLAAAPIPILVLDPRSADGATMTINGNPAVTIVGGPQKSIQVNRNAGGKTDAVDVVGTKAKLDLSAGGPNQEGSDLGTFGGPTSAPSQFIPGSQGHWIAPASPTDDPFAQVCYPGQPTACTPKIDGYTAPAKPTLGPQVPADETSLHQTTSPCTSIPCRVAYKDHGCPDHTSTTRATSNCLLYTPGLYDQTTGFPGGITATGGTQILLFDPGLYYVVGGLSLGSTGITVRPGTGQGDGSGGVTFYFSGASSSGVSGGSGSTAGLDSFNTLKGPVDSTGTAYPNVTTNPASTNVAFPMGVKCLSSSSVPTNLQGGGAGVTVAGNILLGPCVGYYGDPLGASEPTSSSSPPGPGEQRGFVFFQDRSATGVQADWGGAGQFLLAGTMYFHACNSSGTGVGCSTAAGKNDYYSDLLKIHGNACSGTYVFGDVVADQLLLDGTGCLTMDLNPSSSYNILKASLLR